VFVASTKPNFKAELDREETENDNIQYSPLAHLSDSSKRESPERTKPPGSILKAEYEAVGTRGISFGGRAWQRPETNAWFAVRLV
jgi:hypothetical protein